MAKGELNEYTLQRRKHGAEEIVRMIQSPVTYEQAIEQTRQLNTLRSNPEQNASRSVQKSSAKSTNLKPGKFPSAPEREDI